jgi:preprotein translocase subunit SecG
LKKDKVNGKRMIKFSAISFVTFFVFIIGFGITTNPLKSNKDNEVEETKPEELEPAILTWDAQIEQIASNNDIAADKYFMYLNLI